MIDELDNPVRLTFPAVRGLTPGLGVDFVEVGGQASCSAITAEVRSVPSPILDAGTEARATVYGTGVR